MPCNIFSAGFSGAKHLADHVRALRRTGPAIRRMELRFIQSRHDFRKCELLRMLQQRFPLIQLRLTKLCPVISLNRRHYRV